MITNFGEALPPVSRNASPRKVATATRVAKPMQFEAWRNTKTNVYFLCKKGDKLKRHLFEGSSFQACRDFLLSDCGYEELVTRWEIIKSQENVSDADVRSKSEVINTFPLYDLGDLTVERFHRIYPFRGVEFGDWVGQSEREGLLRKTFVSLADMERFVGKLPLQTLGLAYGDRGAGRRACATYEPSNEVINLTKTKGAGCLAHELFHWMDKDDVYSTPILGHVPRNFIKRCERMDKSRSKAYWALKREIGARVFELWLKDVMSSQGYVNDFLVNIVSPENFGKSLEFYPYLLEDEKSLVYKYLDSKFQV